MILQTAQKPGTGVVSGCIIAGAVFILLIQLCSCAILLSGR